jgi:hypothetical protein
MASLTILQLAVWASTIAHAADDCSAYSRALGAARDVFCSSGFCAAPSNVSAKHDWPSQVTYMHRLLSALTSNYHCYNESTAAQQTLEWLEHNQTVANGSIFNWGYTWTVFQVQYYDMPRKPGVRIESPDTLGRKCWAFAYLDQICDATPLAARAPLFAAQWASAVPFTLELCEKVMANCFVNASYDPAFTRENLLRGFPVHDHFKP